MPKRVHIGCQSKKLKIKNIALNYSHCSTCEEHVAIITYFLFFYITVLIFFHRCDIYTYVTFVIVAYGIRKLVKENVY